MSGADHPLDWLSSLRDPGAAAELAAEAVRAVNRLTLRAPSPDAPCWEEVGDLYRVIGELRVLAERLPQAIDQLCRHLQRPAAGVYHGDSGTLASIFQ